MDAFERGIELEKQGKYGEAITAFEEATTANPQYVAAWVHLGTMLQFTGSLAESIEAFDKAVALDPKDAYGWQGKARSLIEFKAYREREALDAANAALEINPNLADAHYDKGALWRCWSVKVICNRQCRSSVKLYVSNPITFSLCKT